MLASYFSPSSRPLARLRLAVVLIAASAPWLLGLLGLGPPMVSTQDAQARALRAEFTAGQATRIASHPYFSNVAFDRFEPDEDFVFLVQQNPAAKAGALQALVDYHHAWMREAEARFVKSIARPAGLTRSNGGAPHVVFLLTSTGDYRNYQGPSRACGHYVGAVYDPFLSATVTFDRVFGGAPSPEVKRSDQVHAFEHSLEQAYGVNGFSLPGPEWLAEGLAVVATFSLEGASTGGSDSHPIPKSVLKALVDAEQKGGHAQGQLRSVADLMSSVRRRDFRRSVKGRGKPYWENLRLLALESGALVKFLRDGRGEKGREAFLRFTGIAMRQRNAAPTAAVEAFGNLKELDAQFWSYLHGAYLELEPTMELKVLPHTVLASAAGAAATAAGSAAAAGAAGAQPPFDPKVLALGDDDPKARFGLALFDAREGRLRTAAADLKTLIEVTDDPRFEREYARTQALLDARERYLDHMVKSRGKLRIKLDGKKLNAVIEGRDGDVLRLGSNRLKLAELAVADIDLVELVSAMADEGDDFGSDITHLYAYALCEDSRLKRKLRRVDNDGGLAEDAPSLGSYIAVGLLATRVRELASAEVASLDSAGGQKILDALEFLRDYVDDIEFLGVRKEDLRTLGEQAAVQAASALSLDELLRGAAASLEGDRWRITYDFTDAAQLDDFQRDDEYYQIYRSTFPEVTIPSADHWLECRDGALSILGTAGLRLPLTFKGPQRVNYTFSMHLQDGYRDMPAFSILMCLCDDRNRNLYYNYNFGGLGVVNRKEGVARVADDEAGHLMFPQADYEFGFEFTGSDVTWYLNGERQHTAPGTSRDAGELFLMIHSELEFRMASLSVEGQVEEASLTRLRAQRAAELIETAFPR